MCFLFALSNSVQAQQPRTWYVSSSYTGGSSDGTEAAPYIDFYKVNLLASNNDIILLKRGDVFNESLVPPGYNITIADYGPAGLPQPKMTGFKKIDANDLVGGNIYKCSLATRPKVIASNGSLLPIGRTPNSNDANGGYYTYNSFGTDANGNFIEASDIDNDAKEVVIRTRISSIETKPVQNIDGNKIYYSPTIGINGGNNTFLPDGTGNGYYFQDGLNTLDSDGEWYYDEANSLLWVYFSNGPQDLYVGTIDILCNLNDYSGTTIRNIDFEGANKMGVDLDNSQFEGENVGLNIEHCNFRYIGIRAVRAKDVKDLYIYNCTFTDCLSGGVQFYSPAQSNWQPFVKMESNSFTNIAPWPGMAYNTDQGDNCAITCFVSEHSYLQHNTFTDIGKAAIYWQGNNVFVNNNIITRAMKTFSDYGPIYTYVNPNQPPSFIPFTNRVVQYNLIYDCPGDYYGTAETAPRVNGIYLDGKTMNVIVKNNTIFNMGASGITSNNPQGIVLENNTLYNNPFGIRFSHLANYLPAGETIDMTIKGNNIYNTRGLVNEGLLNSGNTLSSAISFVSSASNWQASLATTKCINNAYGLTNPLAFYIEVPAGANQPSKWNGLPKWKQLVDEQGTRVFPARATYMPNGEAYKIVQGSTPYSSSGPVYTGWNANVSTTASATTINGELKVTFAPAVNAWASVTKGFSSIATPQNTLQTDKKYLFSYRIRSEAGTVGVCRSYVRISGGIPEPTNDNYRVYTDEGEGTVVEFLIYVHEAMPSPVFCIDIDRTSGPAYISEIRIRKYDESGLPVSGPEDFVDFAYNPFTNSGLYTHYLPEQDIIYKDIYGYEAIDKVDFYGEYVEAYILFKSPLINARPYIATPPLLPADEATTIAAYPNPAHNIITIAGLFAKDEWQSATIINSEGKIVLIKRIAAGAVSINIPVALLQKGYYFINLKSKNNRSHTTKFLKD